MQGSFHGWRIVTAGIVAQTFGVGLLGGYGFFVTPLAEEFGASNARLGAGMSLFALTGGLLGPVLGPLLDRGHVRALMLAGVALMGAGCVALARASTLMELGAFLMLVAAGILLYGPLPVHVLLVNWFAVQRGRALALAALGVSVPGFFIPPLTAWLIDGLGWRSALVALGLGSAAIVAPVLALTVVRRPEDIGQWPDGRPGTAADAGRSTPGEARRSNRELFGDPNFWLIAIAFALILGAPMLNGVYLVRHMEEAGITRQMAGGILAWMALFGVLGKLGVASIADRMDPRLLVWLLVVVQLASWLLVILEPGPLQMLIAGTGFGLGIGGFVPLPTLFVGTFFGRNAFGRVAGLMGPLRLPITLSIVPAGGWLADQTDAYGATFALAIAMAASGALLLIFLRAPRSAVPAAAPA